MKRTGAIWLRGPRSRAQTVRRVCEALERRYGRPRHGNPQESVDDLVYIILSNRTSPKLAQDTYARIKRAFSTWNQLVGSSDLALYSILERSGLASVKSGQIKQALQKIADDFGSCSLTALEMRGQTEIEAYLLSLPGVSQKVAKCVMMFTMGATVLPVDSHVHRVAGRLGWTMRKRADQCHEELEALVPPHRRYAFHVDCIAHGRKICRPRNPRCSECVIARHCLYPAGRKS